MLDKDIEDANVTVLVNKSEKEYYALNISGSSTLKNGFRFIKELLLQHHNFLMHQSYQKLLENDIQVYSIKKRCFNY